MEDSRGNKSNGDYLNLNTPSSVISRILHHILSNELVNRWIGAKRTTASENDHRYVNEGLEMS
ncbi:hypothetical protein AVEN_154977-1, partial [Araneus ventricosus]